MLGTKGITSTNANYLANLAKECCKEAESKLKSISFTNKTVELINGDKKTLRLGLCTAEGIEELITRISNLNAFCAWMREAIKHKENTLNYLYSIDIQKFCSIKGIEYSKSIIFPDTITEEDVIDDMNTKDRNNYLRLEAFASTFGKYIHPGGSISNAREDALHCKQVPTEIDGNGRDMVIYSYTPSTTIKDVDELFMKLQNKYREYEKQLNTIKFNIKAEVNKRNNENLQKYQEDLDKFHKTMNNLRAEKDLYVNKEIETISAMKITIPEKLQSTYEYLESLGKVSKS